MSGAMLDLVLYTFLTPNCLKVSILLEELGLPYRTEAINMFRGDQQAPAFVALNPNAKIPVLRNLADNMILTESNAILMWLAERAGKMFPSDQAGRRRGIELLFLQASSIGPTFGHRTYFTVNAPELDAAPIRRFVEEGERLTDLTEGLLGTSPYLLGDDYSIVDIAFFPWFYFGGLLGFTFADRPRLAAWFDRIGTRPGVQRGIAVPLKTRPPFPSRRDVTAGLTRPR